MKIPSRFSHCVVALTILLTSMTGHSAYAQSGSVVFENNHPADNIDVFRTRDHLEMPITPVKIGTVNAKNATVNNELRVTARIGETYMFSRSDTGETVGDIRILPNRIDYVSQDLSVRNTGLDWRHFDLNGRALKGFTSHRLFGSDRDYFYLSQRVENPNARAGDAPMMLRMMRLPIRPGAGAGDTISVRDVAAGLDGFSLPGPETYAPEKELWRQANTGTIEPFHGKSRTPSAIRYAIDGARIAINPPQLPLNSARGQLKRLPNVDPTLHSFDLSRIDPIHDIKAGQKHAVFQRLKDTDVDYDTADADFVVKKGIEYETTNKGFGSNYAQTITNTDELRTTWGVSVKRKAAVTTGKGDKESELASTSQSASYQKIEQDLKSKTAFYSVARQMHYKYKLQTDPNVLQLTQEFVQDVNDLPVGKDAERYTPQAGQNQTCAARIDCEIQRPVTTPRFKAYADFVKKWGTHYVTQMNYGGAMYVTIRFDETTTEKLRGEKWNASLEAKAKIKNLEITQGVGFNYERSAKVSETINNRLMQCTYLGGESDCSSFSVGNDPEPIDIEVAPLSDLLAPDVFWRGKALMTPERLPLREQYVRQMRLQNEINIVARSFVPAEPRAFAEFQVVNVEFPDEGGASAIYGNVAVDRSEFVRGSINADVEHTNIFSRSDAPGARVVLEAGQKLAFDNNPVLRHLVNLPPDLSEGSRKTFKGEFDLKIWKPVGAHVVVPQFYFDFEVYRVSNAYPNANEESLTGAWINGTQDSQKYWGENRARVNYRYRLAPLWLIPQDEWPVYQRGDENDGPDARDPCDVIKCPAAG